MVTSLLLFACGIDPARVPTHLPYGRDGAVIEDERVAFALVGSTRALVPGDNEVSEQIIADVASQIGARDLDFVALTGGYVRKSGTGEWEAFDERWDAVLTGGPPSDATRGAPVLALPGEAERWGDKGLVGYGASFPAQGPDIGLGRVASWGSFDLRSGPRTWRVIWLDPHEAALGSRWQEQLFWLPKVASTGFDQLLVLLPDARYSGVEGRKDDPDGDVAELLGVIDEHSPMSSLVGVFSGGTPANALLLPTGAYGEAHLLAGAAGIPADALDRSTLEPAFDGALASSFEVDKPATSPQGWWVGEITGGRLLMTFRMRVDGVMTDVYAAKWTKKDGWVGAAVN